MIKKSTWNKKKGKLITSRQNYIYNVRKIKVTKTYGVNTRQYFKIKKDIELQKE